MKKGICIFSAGALLIAACISPSLAAADQDSDVLSVAPAIRLVLEPLAQPAVARPIRRAIYKIQNGAPTASGWTESTYLELGNGLWGIHSVRQLDKGASDTRTISLCGLVDLVAASEVGLEFDNTVSVPVGRIFIPLGMHTSKKLSFSANATHVAFEHLEAVCNPTPGIAFSYEVQTDTRFSPPSSLFGSTPKTLTNSFEWTCLPSERRPASDVFAGLIGQYIPVTCKGRNSASGATSTTRLAFLTDSSFYIRLDFASEPLQSRTDYSEIELQPSRQP